MTNNEVNELVRLDRLARTPAGITQADNERRKALRAKYNDAQSERNAGRGFTPKPEVSDVE
ncbi:MAG: hypothetical protein ABI119_05870 [Gemmatimonadaceae bacterium]